MISTLSLSLKVRLEWFFSFQASLVKMDESEQHYFWDDIQEYQLEKIDKLFPNIL